MEEIINNKKDNWMVINNKVLDLTSWIKKHPGGPIIKNGLGKEATDLFNKSNHSTGAKSKIDIFIIGYIT